MVCIYLVVIPLFVGGMPQQSWAGKKKTAACKKNGKDKNGKACKKQEKADKKTQDGAKQSGDDGMGGAVPAMIGAALVGGAAAMMAANAALADAEQKSKEAQERIRAELKQKLADAEKLQRDKLNQGAPPKLGPVQRVNPATAPDGIAAEGSSPQGSTPQELVGGGVDGETTGQGGETHKNAAIFSGHGGDGTTVSPASAEEPATPPSGMAESFSQLPEGSARTAAAIKHAVRGDMLDITRELIMDLIDKGEVQEAARQIAGFEVSVNVKLAQLGHELRLLLNDKLVQLGLPADELGLALLEN